MNLGKLSNEDLNEWRASPITEVLREAVERIYSVRKQEILDAYWRGEPKSEAQRLAVLELQKFREDFFEADADDLRSWLEEDEG